MRQAGEGSAELSLASPLDTLNRRLREEFEHCRAAGADPADAFRGLYLEEGAVAGMIGGLPRECPESLRAERLQALAELLELDAFDVDVLLACLAPELDLRYESIYAFLQNDISRKRPTVDLLLKLFAAPAARAGLRTRFHPLATLIRTGLLGFGDGSEPGEAPVLGAALRIEERVVLFLLGHDALDARLLGFVEVDDGHSEAFPGAVPEATAATVDALAARDVRVAALIGPPMSGRRSAAARLARAAGRRLLCCDVAGLLASGLPPALGVRLVFREAFLANAAVYWAGADALWDEDPRVGAVRGALVAELGFWPVACLLGGGARWEPPPVLEGHAVPRAVTALPNAQERERLWRELIADRGAGPVPAALPVSESAPLAASFRLTGRQIHDAIRVAESQAELDGSPLEPRHLYAGARAVSGRRLTALGQEIVPKATWERLVLPLDAISQLRELCETVRQRGRVLEEWGFARRLARGTGVTTLFTGVSGTGKTMAAEVVAGELGLALFRIDLAGVVSKWIGETEKNLDRVFQAAGTRTRSCSSTRPSRCSASAARSRTPTIATPTSRSPTCCRRWRRTTA